MYMDVFIEGR